jgi:hypothetical protein
MSARASCLLLIEAIDSRHMLPAIPPADIALW